MLPYTCLSCSCIWSYFRPFPKRFRCDWLTSQARYVRVHFTRRAMHASCESPWHSLAKHHLLGACFPRMAPFRSMLLTLRGGPDSNRGAHHVLGHVTRHALRLRGDSTLLHVGHEAVGILPKTRIHPLVDRLRLERLAHHAQHVPLPLATQEIVGQVLQMLPARALGIIAPAGGEQMQVRVILPIAAMGVEHGNIAPSECLAPDRAKEIIQALRPTAHERT